MTPIELTGTSDRGGLNTRIEGFRLLKIGAAQVAAVEGIQAVLHARHVGIIKNVKLGKQLGRIKGLQK